MNKVIPLLIGDKLPTSTGCPRCDSEALLRSADRTIKLHAQTACQLAQAETQLVEAKQQIRELQARLGQEES